MGAAEKTVMPCRDLGVGMRQDRQDAGRYENRQRSEDQDLSKAVQFHRFSRVAGSPMGSSALFPRTRFINVIPALDGTRG